MYLKQGWHFGKLLLDQSGKVFWNDDASKGWGSEGWYPATFAVAVQVFTIFDLRLNEKETDEKSVQELALWRGKILRMQAPDDDGKIVASTMLSILKSLAMAIESGK